MAKQQPDVNAGLSWLGTILQYIKEYGFFNIIKSLILLMLTVLTLKLCYDPSFLFERYKQWEDAIHTTLTTIRMQNDSNIQVLLPEILNKTEASRVWIIQYHNGTSDWNYGSMRFELCANNVESVKWHYNDFHLSWLTLPGYLKEHRYYINTVDNLKDIDCGLHDMLSRWGVQYVATVEIKTETTSVGVLGCTWETVPNLNPQDIRAILNRYSGKLEELLSPQTKFRMK